MKKRALRIPEVLTASEQEALLAQPNLRYPTGARNKTMIQLMLDTGLRLAEACNLQWKDIDLNTGKLMVRQGKGSKDRTLWIGVEDLEALRTWRERQATDVTGNPAHVFTTLEGKAVSKRYVQAMVGRLAAKAGIEKHVHPHTLRHSFATDLYRETSKIRLVQKALGHSDLSTTMIYTHIFDEELEDALKSFRQPATVTA